MFKLLQSLFEFLGFIEKAIPSDEIRESRHEIKKPKLSKKVQEWLENKWKRDAEAKLRTLNLDHLKKIDRQIKRLIEWGAQPLFIEIQDGYLLFKYVKDDLQGSERIKL